MTIKKNPREIGIDVSLETEIALPKSLLGHVDVLEGDIAGVDGPAAVFIDIIGRPLTPRSFAGAARRGAWYAGAAAVAAAPYYRGPCGHYPYPPCY